MDPNATLAEIRAIVTRFQTESDYESMDELVEYVQAMDEWLSRGGFEPEAWRSV